MAANQGTRETAAERLEEAIAKARRLRAAARESAARMEAAQARREYAQAAMEHSLDRWADIHAGVVEAGWPPGRPERLAELRAAASSHVGIAEELEAATAAAYAAVADRDKSACDARSAALRCAELKQIARATETPAEAQAFGLERLPAVVDATPPRAGESARGERQRQRVLLTGLDCLPGQGDLFDTP